MIRFSCSDYTFPLLTRRQSLQLIRLLEFDFVDLGLFDRSAELSPRSLVSNGEAFARSLKRDLSDAGLNVSDLFLQIGARPDESAANDPSEAVRSTNRDIFRRSLDLCAELGCVHLTGLPGVWHQDASAEQDILLAVEEAQWRVQAANDAGIQYAIEPHIGSLCESVASTQHLLSAAPGLTLTLDYGHFVAQRTEPNAIHALLPFASHIHARGGAEGRLQTPVAENEIDFAGIMKSLQEIDYVGFIALEYVWVDWKGCNRVDNISETILLRRRLQELNDA